MAVQRWKALRWGQLKPNHRAIQEGQIFEFDFDIPVEEGGYSHLVKPDAKKGDDEFGVRETRIPSWVIAAKPLVAGEEQAVMGAAPPSIDDSMKPPKTAVGKSSVEAAKLRAAELKATAKAQREAKGGGKDPTETASGKIAQAQKEAKGQEI